MRGEATAEDGYATVFVPARDAHEVVIDCC